MYSINANLITNIIEERVKTNPYLSLEKGEGSYVDASIDDVKTTSYMSGESIVRTITATITPLNIVSSATDKGMEVVLYEEDFKDTTVSNIRERAFSLLTIRGSIVLVNELYRSNQYEK